MPHHSSENRTPVQRENWAGFFSAAFADLPMVAILRGLDPATAVETATRVWEAGVQLLEVTIERPESIDALRAVVSAAQGRHLVGAGTVTTPQRLNAAVAAGAQFAVAPGLDIDTVETAADQDVPLLPGVSTASEVGQAQRLGLTFLKAFPACALGPSWVHALRGPFPEVGFVPTGGVNEGNATAFLDAGAAAVGIGSSLAGTELRSLTSRLRNHRPSNPATPVPS
jgi:2-dehydro-3-deoxyphosphogluconate aldolase / (4S)-4-hydroxy-2-oxoglutarate aldolase